MTGLKFSDVIVPDTENQATGGMLASCAHSTGRQTKYRAVEAVARRRRNSGQCSEAYPARGFTLQKASYPRPPWNPVLSQNYRETVMDVEGRKAAPPPN